MDIHEQIKAAREFRKMSQTELGKEMGQDQGYISKLESGVHAPVHETLKKLSKILNYQFVIN